MKFPKFLKEGGTIGFAAPSFGCNIEPYRTAFAHSLDRWHEMGYTTVLGPNVYEGSGIGISNTPEACGRELTECYVSNDSDILISCGGGELMCETMDHVDFDQIRKAPPKWFLGYSDNTNMTFLLATLADVASIYGPCAPAFGMEPWHASIQDTYDILCGRIREQKGYPLYETESLKDEEHPLAPYHVTEPRQLETYLPHGISSAKMKGRLIGGCLDCLVNLAGTSFDQTAAFAERYKEDGLIWFLEACDLNVYSIRRALWHLSRAGWFSHVKGFLIGRPLNGEEMFGLDSYHAVVDILKDYNVPIIMGLDIGHVAPMMPLILGSMAEVSCEGQDFSLQMTIDRDASDL